MYSCSSFSPWLPGLRPFRRLPSLQHIRKTPLEQPFRGLVNYAAVLCFLFEEREAVYFALRAMFARYWCKLNALRSGSGMLLCLLRLFEVRLCIRTEVVLSCRSGSSFRTLAAYIAKLFF